MKRTLVIYNTAVFSLMACTPAYAGILGNFRDGAFDQVLAAVIAGVFFILAAFLGKTALKFKKMVQEGAGVIVAIYRATQDGSPGGKSITAGELKTIIEKSGSFGAIAMLALRKEEGK